ncbi:MAG: DUF1116 domain-containing protein [Afipia sp.]|nr:DUF1116 domain-containing protein [Afipia sp.]OJW65460.1 MAG: hypothetical protein BGO65_12070 [Afipia sp. 64-13]
MPDGSGVDVAALDQDIDRANAGAIDRICHAGAWLVDLQPARDLIDIGNDEFLHAGPPLAGWQEACGPLKGAVIANLIERGRAATFEQGEEIAASGAIRLVSASTKNVAATAGGVIAAETQLFVMKDKVFGNVGFAAINEGRGHALRYGSYDIETRQKYRWMESEFATSFRESLKRLGEIDILAILRQALNMGDEGHSRQKAASAMIANTVAPYMPTRNADIFERVMRFLCANEIFFLPLTMAAGKAVMASARNIPNCSIVTAMAGNGVDWGIQIGGRDDEWFTAPVPPLKGLYFEGFTEADASPVMGDSEVAESMGLGALAIAAAPALARYMGGTVSEAYKLTERMYAICVSEHPTFKIGTLEFRGTPLGIDVRRVVKTGISPIFNSGIAHREPGIGQIGAGYGVVPFECCRAAAASLYR